MYSSVYVPLTFLFSVLSSASLPTSVLRRAPDVAISEIPVPRSEDRPLSAFVKAKDTFRSLPPHSGSA